MCLVNSEISPPKGAEAPPLNPEHLNVENGRFVLETLYASALVVVSYFYKIDHTTWEQTCRDSFVGMTYEGQQHAGLFDVLASSKDLARATFKLKIAVPRLTPQLYTDMLDYFSALAMEKIRTKELYPLAIDSLPWYGMPSHVHGPLDQGPTFKIRI